MVSKKELQEFETKIGDLFNEGKIAAPIHLSNGNEEPIQEIFKNIDIENDWVCCTWRNHYQALLKGVTPERLTEEIMKGKSMVMNLPEHKFICSSIVGGIPSIATGIALANKLSGTKSHVWCWLGDMSAETGAFHEALKYAQNHELPITFIVEDNHLSVTTPTRNIWNRFMPYYITYNSQWVNDMIDGNIYSEEKLKYYEYTNTLYPHAGAGRRVQF